MKSIYSLGFLALVLAFFTANAGAIDNTANTANPYPEMLEDGVTKQDLPPPDGKNCKFSYRNAQNQLVVYELPVVCIVPPPSKLCGPIDVGWHNEFGQKTDQELFYWFDKEPCKWEANTQVDGYFRPEWKEFDVPGVTTLCACKRTGSFGCFPPGTKISMADGSPKLIEKISTGDKVLNPVNKKAVRVGKIIQSAEANPLIEIGYEGVKVRVTQTHPMMTNKGLRKAADLALGDELRGADGVFHKITVLKQLPVAAGQQVVNIELLPEEPGSDGHLIAADGLVTGDFVLQMELNKK